MKYIPLSLFILAFSISSAVAQNTNAQKILGCWTLKKMEFSRPTEFSAKEAETAVNSVVCFEPNGKFTTTKKDGEHITGVYSLSKDGKTLYENADIRAEGDDEDCEIVAIDDKHLVFKVKNVTVHFER